MKRALAAVALAGVIAAAAVAGRADASATKTNDDVAITGAGSTFVYPLISQWIPKLGSALGIRLTYAPIGSGGGIAAVTGRTVDFGASDAPLSADQLAACKGCVQVPWALSATAMIYNLPGLNGRLRLTGPLIAGIYLGKVTRWNDQALRKANPRLNLPDQPITTVHRSDNSGTTYNFTDYLSSVSPEWKTKLGTGVNAQWPVGIGGRGSAGVSGLLTHTSGAIGYADVAYSLQNRLPVASVLNASGRYATPGLRGISAAAATLPRTITGNGTISIVDPPKGNPLAYPISTFTWVIVPTGSPKASALRRLVYWAVTQGQKDGPRLLFQPLPRQVQAFDYRQIKRITGSGT